MSDLDYNYHYSKWHDGSDRDYDQAVAYYKYFMRDIISEIPKEAKVLDYGCGTGTLVNYLKQRFDDVVGIDASTSQIQVGQKKGLPLLRVGIDDFNDWCKTHQNTFDVIFLIDVLEHIPVSEQVNFLKSLSSVLKEDAVIFIKVPNANSPIAARWLYIDWTHTTSFTEHSLDFVCHNSNLAIETFLPDETGIEPKAKFLIRPQLRYYYLKKIVRYLWLIYLKSEGQNISGNNLLNKNLFIKCTKK